MILKNNKGRLYEEAPNRQIALKIRALREEKNLTQKELANILNVTVSSIAKYENGERKPSPLILYKIADYFDIEIGGLSKKNKDWENIKNMLLNNENIRNKKLEKLKILLEILEIEDYTVGDFIDEKNDVVKIAFGLTEDQLDYVVSVDVNEFITDLKKYTNFLLFSST